MKPKHLFVTLLCLILGYTTEAQFLKKLKKTAQEAAEGTILRKTDEIVSGKTEKTIDDATIKKDESNKKGGKGNEDFEEEAAPGVNPALGINTEAKKAFYKEDVVIKLHENGNLNQTQYFDADEVAVKMEGDKLPKPGYADSEGLMYGYDDNEGRYTKSSMVALQSQGMMPLMIVEAYKLPPEPFMASLDKQADQGMTPNPFNGIVEFAFVYEPEQFRYEDFKETKQTIRGETYTKFEFLNEPGYEGSYVLFDSQNRLIEIFTKKSDTGQSMDSFELGSMPVPPGESLLVYEYKPVDVQLPPAKEVRTHGQGMMEMVMGGIVKGGNTKKDEIDEDDYDTSDSKGLTKSVRKSLKNHKVTKDDLPNSYDFDWQYNTTLVIESRKKDPIDMTFLIKEGATYQASKIVDSKSKDMGNATMLFDSELNTMVMFMEAQGGKYLQMFPIPEPRKTNDKVDFDIKELPPKTILGYNCEGLQLEDDRYILKAYHATGTPITLSNFLNFGGNKNMDLPDIDPRIIEQFSDGLIMEMHMTDKKKSKNNMSIIAKSLDKVPTSIKKGEYQNMDFLSTMGEK